MNNSNQTWERVVAIILATGVLITFVFIIFNPQKLNTSTFAIIRFLAAFAAAVSGYLFIGTLEVKARLPFKRGIAKGTGAFAIFIVIYFLFYHNLPPSEPDYSYERTNSGLEPGIFKGKYQSDLVDYKHFTGNNEYPVLAFLSSKFPEEFNDVLGLSNSPIIQTKNPVYENIQKFRDESGNQDLVSNYLSPSRYEYTYNENNKTTVASEEIERGELIGKKQKLTKKISKNKTFNQKSNEYDDKTLVRDGEGNEFTYVPKLASLQTSLDDAKYTSFLRSEASSYYTQEPVKEPVIGEIFQFPKLSSLLTYDGNPDYKQITIGWINNIISHNPSQRGLVAYTYNFVARSFQSQLAKLLEPRGMEIYPLFLDGCSGGTTVRRQAASPYVRFLDIWNPSNSSVNLESMERQIISKDSYTLTEIDQRDKLFEKIPTEQFELKIRIPPNQHLFILTEFGFDNRAIKLADYLGYSNFDSNGLSKISDQPLYISRPDLKSFDNEPRLDQITSTVELPNEFITSTKDIKSLINGIPKRLAVGSVLNINSLTVNGKKIKIDPPLNEPQFSLSAYFDYGSCPYLLVFDSEKQIWKELGTVLSGLDSANLQQTKLYQLGNKPIKFKIQERDPEITYLDSLSLIYKDSQTNELKEVFYTADKLEKIDHEYFELHQGEFLEIDLGKILPSTASDIKLKINGYYELI
jgi:hypothetical protein